ncbi:LuxR C-terminal-related transcriptional regulator [Caenispirillum salinarum]|uniref:LuxR C-terminal-related transcriptional regulator n=1 Tax=Caenispirillum salinarum TaxID=859058 RepID=UPI0038512DAC
MRVVLADDHELVRSGLRPFLEELADSVEVEEHGDLDGLLAGAAAADLVIMDLRMPGVEGAACLTRVTKAFAPAPVVVLSASQAVDDILAVARAGLAAYLPKTMPGPAMVAALRLVLLGERYFPASAFEAAGGSGDSILLREAPARKPNPLGLLSAREREILEHMIEGETNKAIAKSLTLQEITVKVHLRNIYRKMGAANRTQAVRIALENGWQL